ncbi:MAG TPA: hypothetical protein VFU74_16510 [Actinocrinis sp.]|nr:hypothetical protein [Actinocrinis sp.]
MLAAVLAIVSALLLFTLRAVVRKRAPRVVDSRKTARTKMRRRLR